MERLGQDDIDHSQRRVVCISQDAFYRSLTDEEQIKAQKVHKVYSFWCKLPCKSDWHDSSLSIMNKSASAFKLGQCFHEISQCRCHIPSKPLRKLSYMDQN